MTRLPEETGPLDRVRDALIDAGRKAERVAESVEGLEVLYATVDNPNPGYFYVPTELDNTWGCALDREWTDHAPASEHRLRREAIDATLALRAAVDNAMGVVAGIAPYMDSEAESVAHRWTTRTIGSLRKLRGAIVLGHGDDVFPSALPMIRAGVPGALREHARHIMDRMEEVKSAIVAGTKPRIPRTSVSSDQADHLAKGISGTDTDWKDVLVRLLAKSDRGEPYTSLRLLATELGCSDRTVRKAIDSTKTLTQWKDQSMGPKAGSKASDLSAVVIGNTRQSTEAAPDNVLLDDEVDAIMARLIDQAEPDERAKLNALTYAEQRALVAECQAQNLDDEPSPLELDKPGERPRKVKHHKRA